MIPTTSRASASMRMAVDFLLDHGDTPANRDFAVYTLQLVTHRRKANLQRSLRALMRKEQKRREAAEEWDRKHPPCPGCWSGRTDRPNVADPDCRVCGGG